MAKQEEQHFGVFVKDGLPDQVAGTPSQAVQLAAYGWAQKTPRTVAEEDTEAFLADRESAPVVAGSGDSAGDAGSTKAASASSKTSSASDK